VKVCSFIRNVWHEVSGDIILPLPLSWQERVNAPSKTGLIRPGFVLKSDGGLTLAVIYNT
jgi:hypothetical protein